MNKIVEIGTAFVRALAKLAGGPSREDFLAAILSERPDLCKKTVFFPTQGAAAHTVFIENEVFKGPLMDNRAFRFFNKDCECLQMLMGKGLRVVPEITYIGQKANFYGMQRMPGMVLAGVILTLTPEEKQHLAKDIADFIVDVARVLPRKDGKYARHGDLHPGNILIDPHTKRLTGVIDFGYFQYFSKQNLGRFPLRTKIFYAQDNFDSMIEQEYENRKAGLGNGANLSQ